MDFVYKKVIAFVLSEAAAHSDRIKIAIVGMIMAGFAVIASRCGFCGQFLTPDVADKLATGIVSVVLVLIHSIGNRDITVPDNGPIPASAVPPAPPVVNP